MEATAEALTQEEVLRRCRRRAARLAGVYRWLYWAMAEEVRARHRQYVRDLARSPLEAEQPPAPPGGPVPAAVGEPPKPAPVPRRKKCGFTGCKVRHPCGWLALRHRRPRSGQPLHARAPLPSPPIPAPVDPARHGSLRPVSFCFLPPLSLPFLPSSPDLPIPCHLARSPPQE
jgi:hypothetical protein